jgi:hypothetical protein
LTRRRVFSLAVWVALVLAGSFGLMVLAMQFGLLAMSHFTEHHHRVHDITFALLVGTSVVGMLAQLRAPARNVAGQLMALVPFAALLLSVALTNTAVLSPPWLLVGASTVLALMFHPAGDPVRSFARRRLDPVMLGLVAVAAVPLLALAATNVGLQRAGPNEHAVLGHYGYMAAFSFTVIGAGLLASARPPGWRLVAWVAGALPVLLGLASLLFADVDSSLSAEWAVAAISWGVAFVALAERAGRRVTPVGPTAR